MNRNSRKEVEKVNIHGWEFPGGAVAKNPPANAGDTGSVPGLGRSHAVEQLTCVLKPLKPMHQEPMLCSKSSHHREKPEHHNKDPKQPKINALKIIKK